MRTTLIIDDGLIDRARRLTGIEEKTALVRAGLEALIAREAAKRLAALGGTEPQLAPVPRPRVPGLPHWRGQHGRWCVQKPGQPFWPDDQSGGRRVAACLLWGEWQGQAAVQQV